MKFRSHSIPFRNGDEAKKIWGSMMSKIRINNARRRRQNAYRRKLVYRRRRALTKTILLDCLTCAPHYKYLLSRRSLLYKHSKFWGVSLGQKVKRKALFSEEWHMCGTMACRKAWKSILYPESWWWKVDTAAGYRFLSEAKFLKKFLKKHK